VRVELAKEVLVRLRLESWAKERVRPGVLKLEKSAPGTGGMFSVPGMSGLLSQRKTWAVAAAPPT
jgi:hypothetical protein